VTYTPPVGRSQIRLRSRSRTGCSSRFGPRSGSGPLTDRGRWSGAARGQVAARGQAGMRSGHGRRSGAARRQVEARGQSRSGRGPRSDRGQVAARGQVTAVRGRCAASSSELTAISGRLRTLIDASRSRRQRRRTPPAIGPGPQLIPARIETARIGTPRLTRQAVVCMQQAIDRPRQRAEVRPTRSPNPEHTPTHLPARLAGLARPNDRSEHIGIWEPHDGVSQAAANLSA
jgi:hypothetical protein